MKKTKGIIWGLVIIALGVLWGLNEANVLSFTLFFDGWWTLFIIIPSLIGLITDRDKKGSLICLAIGVLLLVNCYFDLWQYKKFLFPIIVVIVGASIIVGNIFEKEQPQPAMPQQDGTQPQEVYGQPVYIPQGNQEYYASFSSQNYQFDKGFAGGKFCATFGAIVIDIRNADIVHNCVIDAKATFGGIDIYVPSDVRVVVKSNSFFGGVSDKTNKNLPPDAKTIFINSSNLFGGTDVK